MHKRICLWLDWMAGADAQQMVQDKLDCKEKLATLLLCTLQCSHTVCVCRQREAEVQEWMESASQSDRGHEEAQAKSNHVGFIRKVHLCCSNGVLPECIDHILLKPFGMAFLPSVTFLQGPVTPPTKLLHGHV